MLFCHNSGFKVQIVQINNCPNHSIDMKYRQMLLDIDREPSIGV